MSIHDHHIGAAGPPATAGGQTGETEQHDHGGRGHMIGMILCCIPMVIAIVWILASSNR